MMSSKRNARVVVVGAGPVGMVCALALNRRGIPVTVFETEPAPVKDQRAATIHPPSLEMLDELGVFEKILPLGLKSNTYRFHDRPSGSVVAEFDLDLLKDEIKFPFVLQYEQYKLTASIAAEYANAGDFDVRFSHNVTGLTQTADGIDVEVTSPAGVETMRADYVIGCDGGRSTVRKLADIEFEGFTYPEKVHQDRDDLQVRDGQSRSLLPQLLLRPARVVQPVQGARRKPRRAVARDLPDSRRRGRDHGAVAGAARGAAAEILSRSPGATTIEYVNLYGVHQRVAATFRKGRILLAGDSAHVNNPIGGMGMNGGMHDGINLAGKLAKVIHGEAGEELLDLYSRQRRHAAVKYVQAQTIANKRLMEERDPAVRKANFDELRRTADNKDAARAYMRRAALFDSLRDAAAVT